MESLSSEQVSWKKGTTNGVTTDLYGKFSLNVKRGATLVISYIGYKTQEAKADANMKITLTEDSELLDEVVVVGYGVQKKKLVTGATVQVKGTHNGVITNENGEYTIKNVSPGQVLVFSMIGMNTVEKTVGSQNRIDVLMDAGVLIDEVVVTGYQTQRKVDLTGSVSSLSSDQFMQTTRDLVAKPLCSKQSVLAHASI